MTSPPKESVQCAIQLRSAVSSLSRGLRVQDRHQGFSLAGLSILGLLYRHGSLTATELAKLEGVKPQTLTRLLAGLETDGLIARQPHSSDGRQSSVSLTRLGTAQLKQYANHRENLLTAVIDNHLSAAERDILLRASELMGRVAELLMQLPPSSPKHP